MPLSTKQIETAAIIARVGRDVGATREQIIAAISGAWIESRLGILDGGDNGTAWGIFQQREVAGWGSKSYVENPYNAARDFFTGHAGQTSGLLDVWSDTRTPGLNVQAVQNSAYKYRYDGAMNFARSVISQVEEFLGTDIQDVGADIPSGPTVTPGTRTIDYGIDLPSGPTVTPGEKKSIDLTKPTEKTSALSRFVLLSVGLLLILLAGMRLSK